MKHKHYHNRLLVDREWTRIAADLQETKEVVKNKWKNLRDRFKKELNKIPKYRSGDDGENASQYNSTWSHFESMLFLRHILTPKATEGNIVDSGSTSHATQLSQECETEIIPSETSFDKEPDDDELSLPSTASSKPSTKRVTRVLQQQQTKAWKNCYQKKTLPLIP
nr:unnamed protein product [Callosobruchus analis]